MADHTPDELEHRFWKQLRHDMTVMLGLPGEVAARPMTAQLRTGEDHGPIWFFTSTDTDLCKAVAAGTKAEMAFVAKGNDLFATVHGTMRRDDDRSVIDDLWSPYVAAWFEGGKDDPKLALLRLDPTTGEIWLNANSLLEGVKMLVGAGDPKEDYKDQVAKVDLS